VRELRKTVGQVHGRNIRGLFLEVFEVSKIWKLPVGYDDVK
jgi:hypothetical protein